MHKLALKVVLAVSVLALVCTAAMAEPPVQTFTLDNFLTAPTENAPGYGFAYQSECQSPGQAPDGTIYYDWWYSFYLENDSTDHAIVSWNWIEFISPTSWWEGPVMPGVHQGTFVGDPYGGADDPMPLQPAPGPSLSLSHSRAEDFSDFEAKVELQSVITWDDGHTEQVPIYVPANYRESMGGRLVVVPEPGSFVAVASGLIGLVGLIGRKRSR